MLSESTIREAFDITRRVYVKVKEGSERSHQLLAMAMVLGWMLDEPKYVEACEDFLGEIRRAATGSVTRGVTE